MAKMNDSTVESSKSVDELSKNFEVSIMIYHSNHKRLIKRPINYKNNYNCVL